MLNHSPKNSGKGACVCVKLGYAHSDSEIGDMGESRSASQPWAVKR